MDDLSRTPLTISKKKKKNRIRKELLRVGSRRTRLFRPVPLELASYTNK
jgi:hypothetical protein